MKIALGLGALVVGLVAGGYAYLLVQGAAKPVCGGSCPVAPATQTAVCPMEASAATQPVDVGNTKCVIETKDDVTAGVTYVHENKTYHFCCKDCIKTFKADPAKYIKDMADHPEKYGIK